jgi:hypothetical protein
MACFLLLVAEEGGEQVHLYAVSDAVFCLGEQDVFNLLLARPMFSNMSTWMVPRSRFRDARSVPDAGRRSR